MGERAAGLNRGRPAVSGIELIAFMVVAGAVAAAVGVGSGIALSNTTVRWSILRRRRAVAALLPTDAPIAGLVFGQTPPVTSAAIRRALLVCLCPGLLLGPFATFLFVWLIRRGRSLRLVAFTTDGTTWLVATKGRSTRPLHVLNAQPTERWVERRTWLRMYATVGAEDLSLPRYGFTDQLPPSSTPAS